MTDQLLFGAVCSFASSVILIIYSGHAHEKGLLQGTLFASGKAMVYGWIGLLVTFLVCFSKSEFLDVLIAIGVSFFLVSPVLLAWFRESVQVISLLGLPIGLVLMLSTSH